MMLEVVASLAIVVIIALCAASLAVGMGILQPANIPGPLMKILDEMTDRPLLEKLISERIPQGESIRVNIQDLREYLNSKIYDQNKVVDAVVEQIAIRFSKIKRNKPVGVFLITGPSGTGKSLMGKAIGEAIYGDGGFYTVAMNKLRSSESISVLFGAAAGLIGSDRKSGLVNHLSNYPKTVVILDEFEKSSQEVQEAFLSAWNDGSITNISTGDPISVQDVVFVLTANAKQDEVANIAMNGELSADQISARCKHVLEGVLSEPILSRIDYVFAYKPMSEKAIAALAADMIREEAKDRGFVCKTVSPHILMNYIEDHFGKGFDGRELGRHIERVFGKAFMQLRQESPDLKMIEITYDKKTGLMNFKPAKAA